MENEFADAVAAWNAFYGAVAGAAATLVGLLFVSLALNPTIMGEDGPVGLRILAGQTFHSFLMVLVISLVALIPGETPAAMAITMGIIGASGITRVARDVRQARTDPDPRWRTRQGLFRFLSPTLAYLISFWAALGLWKGDPNALEWLVATILLLTMSAASSSWDLLKAMGERK